MARNRIEEHFISYWWMAFWSVVALGGVLLVVVLADSGFSEALAYLSVPLAFGVPILFEQRSQRSRVRNVVYLDYRQHHYGQSLYRGMEAELHASDRPWKVERRITQRSVTHDPLQAQTHEIRAAANRGVDALVVLPLEESDEFWDAISFAQQAGVEVIVLDVRPPRRRFERQGLPTPLTVSTDYTAGGRLVGRYIGEQLAADPTARAVLCMGPDQFYAGSERSRQALGELVRLGHYERTRPYVIESWDFDTPQLDDLAALIERGDHPWVLYVAYDQNAIRLHHHLQTSGRWRSNIQLVGYDANADDIGHIPVFDQRAAVASVDVRPEMQGRQAAQLLIDRRVDPRRVHARSNVVVPTLLTAAAYEEMIR